MKTLLGMLVLLTAWSGCALAQGFDCNGAHFRGNPPQINEVHIFCGELRNGRAEGYHSQTGGIAPDVVAVDRVRPIGVQGVYEGLVHFRTGAVHRSTFYPKFCSVAQIETSIRFAAANPIPGRGNDWLYGPSGPAGGGADFCMGSDHRPFEIQFARTSRGGINTAFPDGK